MTQLTQRRLGVMSPCRQTQYGKLSVTTPSLTNTVPAAPYSPFITHSQL